MDTQITIAVIVAVRIGPIVNVLSGPAVNRPETTGSTVTGISIFTVPTKVGVSIRRNKERRNEMTSGINEERSTRIASTPGPP